VGVGDHGPTILSAMTAVASTNTFAVTNCATGDVLEQVLRHGVDETRAVYGLDDWLELKYVCL